MMDNVSAIWIVGGRPLWLDNFVHYLDSVGSKFLFGTKVHYVDSVMSGGECVFCPQNVSIVHIVDWLCEAL
jgi:hypothetical protein